MSSALSGFKALTFDCYGTLIDWEAGIWDAFQPVLLENRRSDIDRAMFLETFAEFENRQQTDTPDMLYPAILQEVHRALAAHFDLRSCHALDAAFGDSIQHWPAFPDTADALRYLKTRYKLVILSNVSRDAFAASRSKLGVEFDAIYTAEDIGSYKPSPANFEYLLSHLQKDLGLEQAEILHTAQSLFHDHVPAIDAGLATAWIDRQRLSESGEWGATAKVSDPPKTDFLFYSMGEMAAAVRAGS